MVANSDNVNLLHTVSFLFYWTYANVQFWNGQVNAHHIGNQIYT
jgi:hypothetical protein